MPSALRPWRVAVTRDDDRGGALASALVAEGLLAVPCPVLVERPPDDPAALIAAARGLDHVDWAVLGSVRGVRALSRARGGPWPPALRTAAVGQTTARAIAAAGVQVPPVVGLSDGSETLWTVLAGAAAWPGLRVLVPTTPGGRADLARHLRAAGAEVTTVEAYRMQVRPGAAIAADWAVAAPDAVVVTSPRTVEALLGAVGLEALRAVVVVAIGGTTAGTLAGLGIMCGQPARADFGAVARFLAATHAAESRK